MKNIKKIIVFITILSVSLVLVSCKKTLRIKGSTIENKEGISLLSVTDTASDGILSSGRPGRGSSKTIEKTNILKMSNTGSTEKEGEDLFFYFNWDGSVAYLEHYEFTPDFNREEQIRQFYNVKEFSSMSDYAVFINYLRYTVTNDITEKNDAYFAGEALLDSEFGSAIVLKDQEFRVASDGQSTNIKVKLNELYGVEYGDTVTISGIQLYVSRIDQLKVFNEDSEGNDRYTFNYSKDSNAVEVLKLAKEYELNADNSDKGKFFDYDLGRWVEETEAGMTFPDGRYGYIHNSNMGFNNINFEYGLYEKSGFKSYIDIPFYKKTSDPNESYKQTFIEYISIYVRDDIDISDYLNEVRVGYEGAYGEEFAYRLDTLKHGVDYIVAKPENYYILHSGSVEASVVVSLDGSKKPFNSEDNIDALKKGKPYDTVYSSLFKIYFRNMGTEEDNTIYLGHSNLEYGKTKNPDIGFNKYNNTLYYSFPIQANTLALYTKGDAVNDHYTYIKRDNLNHRAFSTLILTSKVDGDYDKYKPINDVNVETVDPETKEIVEDKYNWYEKIRINGISRPGSSIGSKIGEGTPIIGVYQVDGNSGRMYKVLPDGNREYLKYQDYKNSMSEQEFEKVFPGKDPNDLVDIDIDLTMNWYLQGNIIIPIENISDVDRIIEFSTYDYYSPDRLFDGIITRDTEHEETVNILDEFFGVNISVLNNIKGTDGLHTDEIRGVRNEFKILKDKLLPTMVNKTRITRGKEYSSEGEPLENIIPEHMAHIRDEFLVSSISTYYDIGPRYRAEYVETFKLLDQKEFFFTIILGNVEINAGNAHGRTHFDYTNLYGNDENLFISYRFMNPDKDHGLYTLLFGE